MYPVLKNLDIAAELSGYPSPILSMEPSQGWSIESCFKGSVRILNFFCQVPFKMHNDGNFTMSKIKLVLFPCILSGAMYTELSNIIFMMNPPDDDENTNMMHLVIKGRSIFLCLYLLGLMINSTLLAPRYILRGLQVCRQMDRSLPLTFSTRTLAITLVCVLAMGVLEGWTFLNFRYPDGLAPGFMTGVIFGTASSCYLRLVTFACDVIFSLLSILNHTYHQEILKHLRRQDKHTIFQSKVPGCKQIAIGNLRELFDLACQLKNYIHQAFKIHFLLTTGSAFVDGTTSIYMAIEKFSRNDVCHGSSFFLYSWCCLLFCKIFFHATFAHFLMSDVEETAVEVHRRFNSSLDSSTKTELIAFSLDISHRKSPFTALHLFTVDYGLFPTIISSISTYIIIMLQFRGNVKENSRLNNFDCRPPIKY